MPALKSLKDASPEEVTGRLQELHVEFSEMDENTRSDADGMRAKIAEIDQLDNFLTLSELQLRDERIKQMKLAATAPPGSADQGPRSIGDMIAGGDVGEALRSFITGHGPDGFRLSFGSEGGKREDGIRAASYLRDGSRYLSASGYREAGMRVTGVDEWSSGGPPTVDSTGSGYLLPQLGQPIPPVPRMARLWLRDLMPVTTTTLAKIPYVQELNPASYEAAVSGGAQTVAEAGFKPTADLSFQSQTADPTVIAATLIISKQLFEDAPAVVQYINTRLPYLVKFAEDGQILNGNGTWPQILGITNASGLQSQEAAGSGTGFTAITLGNAIADVELHDGSASAIVMNPSDAWGMFTNRAAGGSGTFDAGTPFSALPLTVWGIPSYRSRAYAEGSALVGDFQLGGMLFDREQVNVTIYRERYAEQNLILLICEERLGAAWYRPDLFVDATVTD